MSLATSCPSCGTVFRVVQDQLKISEGWVRCGHCQEVFNALEGLFDLARRDTHTHSGAPDLAVPATSNPNDPAWMETRPAMFSDGKVLRERQESLQNRSAVPPMPVPQPPAPPPARPAPAMPTTRVEISTRRAATWDPSVQEPERGLAPTQPDPGSWRTGHQEHTLFPEPEPDSLLIPPDFEPSTQETAYPSTTLEFRSEAFSAMAAARLRHEDRAEVDLALDWPTAPAPLSPPAVEPVVTADDVPTEPVEPTVDPAPAQHINLEAEVSEPSALVTDDLEKTVDLSVSAATARDLDTSAASAENLLPPQTHDITADAVADARETVAPAPSPSPAKKQSSGKSRPADVTNDKAELPDFVRRADSQARWQHPGVRVALGGAALILTGLLAAQAGHHWHDLVAARWPVTKPILARACAAAWSCELRPPQQLDALVVDSTTLTRPPNSDSYVLGVTLHNRVGYAIAAPHIELSLTDLSGAVVLRRVLTPAEFRQTGELSAQAEASWNLEFTSTNQRIAGYTLAAFYP